MNISAQSAGGLPGMGGRASISSGAGNSTANVMLDLQRATVDFGHLYERPGTTSEQITAAAQKIEGFLMVEQTLSMLTEKEATDIINELYDLVKERT